MIFSVVSNLCQPGYVITRALLQGDSFCTGGGGLGGTKKEYK